MEDKLSKNSSTLEEKVILECLYTTTINDEWKAENEPVGNIQNVGRKLKSYANNSKILK